jgi:L-threonylcarbamoyladenylate synthase
LKIVRVDPVAPDLRVIAEAAAALRAGGLVAFPTETVYGLGALALDPGAVRRVFAAKGRPPTHPLIVHVLGEAEARRCAAAWPPLASELASAFWPGPLTLVVEKAGVVPDEVTGGSAGVAVRSPSHPVARALLEALSGEAVGPRAGSTPALSPLHAAIVAPSANRYQSLSPTRAEHVAASLGDADVLVLDAGPCPSGIESTVVDVRGEPPRVLRPGALSIEALRARVPSLAYAPIEVAEEAPRESPGQAERHYAPRTPLVIATDRAAALASAGEGIGVVVFGAPPGGPQARAALHVLPADPAAAGAELYALLHWLDGAGLAKIVVEPPPDAPGWEAVADRLRRAAAR